MSNNNVKEIQIKPNEQIENCSFVKTILMLLIIIYHSCAFWTSDWFTRDPVKSNSILIWISKYLNSFHIYGFVLVSGYIYSFARSELGKYSDVRSFILLKVKRLLIPYCFVVLIYVIPIQQYFFSNPLSIIVKNYIVAENPNQLWFLWMLFDVFMLFRLLENVINKNKISLALSIMISECIFIVCMGRIPNCFQVIRAFQFLPLFILGYAMQKKVINVWRIEWYIWFIADIGLFIVYECVDCDVSLLQKIMHYGIGFVLNIVGAITAWVCLQKISLWLSYKDNNVFKLLSKYSMPMYLFHQQIIYFPITALNGVIHPILLAFICFCTSLLGSILISSVFMHWKTTRMLIGEK